ncbi:PilZ domain-containing protein [Persephonella atlantica]|uniref:PilZ domain-containing protein n=1 Tax=Persephonella atlantica TaxID=2699429 RepID=A0ABS1GJE7_9AQUI|nr:PilZ domain-containing protein [Persephonella atlantica]MBK3333025.1 PilZ domain-containing protein [Persephonella atlantica]
MEKTKSLWKLIGELKKQKKLEVAVFYEEVPIKGVIEISEVDDSLEQIIWKADRKILPVLKETRHIYFKLNEEIFILTVIAYDSKEIATSFPVLALDKKLNRAYVRVKTSESHPVRVEIEGIDFFAEDISEAGVGIISEETKIKNLEEGREYSIKLNVKNEEITVKGIIVYRKKAGKSVERIGIKFTHIKMKDRDKIARCIMERQREIARKISMFKS